MPGTATSSSFWRSFLGTGTQALQPNGRISFISGRMPKASSSGVSSSLWAVILFRMKVAYRHAKVQKLEGNLLSRRRARVSAESVAMEVSAREFCSGWYGLVYSRVVSRGIDSRQAWDTFSGALSMRRIFGEYNRVNFDRADD